MLGDLLPVFERVDTIKPIIARTREQLKSILDDEVRLERLSGSINTPRRDSLYRLEPIPDTVFHLFPMWPTPEPVEDEESPDIFRLLNVGQLTLSGLGEKEMINDKKVTPYSLNIEEYKERRRQRMLQITAPVEEQDDEMIDVIGDYAPNEQDVNDMIESVLGLNGGHGDDTDMLQRIMPAPLTITNNTEIDVTESNETVDPASVSSISATENLWISEDEYTLQQTSNEIPTHHQTVYAYTNKMVPVFPTIEQQNECDKTTALSRTKTNMFFNMHFEKAICALNFPSTDTDYSPETQWTASGKTIFIKQLLSSLIGNDLVLLIVTKDLGEEETLLQLISNVLNLDCMRINYLMEDWDGEYGVFVKTLATVDQTQNAAERARNFEKKADFIIMMDVRISEDLDLFNIIYKRDGTQAHPPISWLISVGSVEEKARNFLVEHQLPFSASKPEAFKELIRQDNTWAKGNNDTVQKYNLLSSMNLKSYLVSAERNTTDYQYRSILHLPQSRVVGRLNKSPIVDVSDTPSQSQTSAAFLPTIMQAPAVVSPEANTSLPISTGDSDMEIESDDAQADMNPLGQDESMLSEVGKDYFNGLFPSFKLTSTSFDLPYKEPPPMDALPLSDIKTLSSIPKSLPKAYHEEVQQLKRQYDIAFQEIREKYRKNAFVRLQKARFEIDTSYFPK